MVKTTTLLENKKLIVVFVVILLVLFLVGGLSLGGKLGISQDTTFKKTDIVEAVDPQTGKKYTFRADGFVTYIDENGNTVSEVWEQNKINAFLEYLTQNFVEGALGGYEITINGTTGSSGSGGDEIITVATGGGGSGGGGGGTSQYFATPTPLPTPYNLPIQGSNPTPQATLPPPAPSWCKFWKLSYCADPLESNATPSPTTASQAIPPTCTNSGNKTTGRTVITNELCVSEEDIVEP